jgi:phosphoglucomutase
MGLLAGELMARTGRDPSELYAELTGEGRTAYERIERPPPRRKRPSSRTFAGDVSTSELADYPIEAVLTKSAATARLSAAGR